MIIKICQTCWKEFKARKNKQKFCSQSCSSKSRRILQNVVCATCGKIFQPVHKKDKYCSRKCSSEWRKKWSKCPTCWKQFNNKFDTKYCSQKCYAMSRVNPNIICPVCWKTFHPSAGQKYCSNKCWGIAQRTHMRKICPICGKTFRENYIWQVHCSNECYNSTREVKEKACPSCWKVFKPSTNATITCSRECHSKYMKDKRESLTEEEKKEKISKLRDCEEEIISKPNKELAGFLVKKWFDVSFEFSLNWYFYDLKVWDTLIEVNPWAHHNSTWAPPKNKHSKPKNKYYHQDKVICAIKNWFNIIMVWDWVSKETIVELLTTPWLASDCYIPKWYDINKLWEPKLHRYRKKWKQHILDNGHDRDEMLSKWFVEIYDAWNI